MDKFGSMTWLLIDGNKNVYEICEGLREEFGEEIEPVYDRVSLFISKLYKNKFIIFKEISEGKNYG